LIGGNIALQVAASAPERLDALVLVGADSPDFDPDIDYQSPGRPLAVEAFKAGDRRVAELEAEMWLTGRGRARSDLDPETVDIPQLIAAADDLVANLGQRPPVVIEDTAHIPSMDRPLDFNSALAGFLASI